MQPDRARRLFMTFAATALALMFVINALGLILTSRLVDEVRAEQDTLHQIVAQNQRITRQHRAQSDVAQDRTQARLDQLLADLRRIRLEGRTRDGRTIVIRQVMPRSRATITNRPAPEGSPSRQKQKQRQKRRGAD